MSFKSRSMCSRRRNVCYYQWRTGRNIHWQFALTLLLRPARPINSVMNSIVQTLTVLRLLHWGLKHTEIFCTAEICSCYCDSNGPLLFFQMGLQNFLKGCEPTSTCVRAGKSRLLRKRNNNTDPKENFAILGKLPFLDLRAYAVISH